MRILLDSRDLINFVEHGRPIAAGEFAKYLRSGNHEIVLSFTNIRELSGPLAAGVPFLEIRPLLQSLEAMPHAYLQEVTIVGREIQAAVDAFNKNTEYQSFSPYVPRWDHTLIPIPGQRSQAAEDWVNFRLDEIVYDINLTRPDVFAPPQHHLPALQEQLERDRIALRSGQAAPKKHFADSIKKHARTHRVTLPNGRENEFTAWAYRNPDRCPGLRLNHEVYRALMANYGDIPETSDFSDLAHIFAIPYVDMATLDRRMKHYCEIASRNLSRLGAGTNWSGRVQLDVIGVIQECAPLIL
jgi:hypothetical protein